MVTLLSLVCVSCWLFTFTAPQENETQKAVDQVQQEKVEQIKKVDDEEGAAEKQSEVEHLKQKVDLLEKRLAILEEILFSNAKLDTMRAERLLEDAKSRLKNSQSLYRRGLVTRVQLELEEMQVNMAKREVELANASSGIRLRVGRLDVAEAEQRLRMAEQNLETQLLLAQRGYISADDVRQSQQAVDVAKRRLENAQVKLKAVMDLEELNVKDRQNK